MKPIHSLSDSQRALVEDNLILITYALKKIPLYLFDSREDAYQIGCIGLMKAARSFDAGRNILFTTYATTCIVNELLMAVRRIHTHTPAGGLCSCDAPVASGDGETPMIELIPSGDELTEAQYVARETLATVLSALKAMKDPDAVTLIRMVIENRRQDEMAAVLGVTQSAISRRLRKIRADLRHVLRC